MLVRRFGLADGLGIVAGLVALIWIPGIVDPLTYPKLLVLLAGGLALAPAVARRWSAATGPRGAVVLPAAAAALLVLWGVVTLVGSGAPFWNSLFGWWGRGDGLLAWIGAAVLLLGAATLSHDEVARTITWMLGAATVVALVGLLQVVGIEIPEGGGSGINATMGNTNFAAGYFAVIAALALGRALTTAALWHRVWGGVLFVILAVLAFLTDSVQGPVALAAGVVAMGVAYAFLNRGRFRTLGIAVAGVVLASLVALLATSLAGVGPLTRLWSERTFEIRQEYWQSALNIMQGQPLFGTGPDGFARYVSEYRPESYVELLGPVLRVSAAHNIALQFGAVGGYVALILWLIAFVGAGVLLLNRVFRAPVASVALTASVAGALVAYLTQGMVSIDMLPLLATGWTAAGLALAVSREPAPSRLPPAEVTSSGRKTKGAVVSRTPKVLDRPATPAWVPVTGAVLPLAAVILVGSQIGLVEQIRTVSTQEQAIAFATNARTPCPLRLQMTQEIIGQLPADQSVPATIAATELDQRCAPMVSLAADLNLQLLAQEQDPSLRESLLAEAGQFTEAGVSYDPLADLSWALRARYFLAEGDLVAAEAAALEAERVQALYPEGSGDAALLEAIRGEISAVRGPGS